ncbi:Replication factor C subunit [Apis cerana cerana]|uniref:Replication factor C subunit 1 n=1 Tax=Apis cerana cerana TaxID=94128 RepID=A0A2A3E8M9_APICC|nr:Replication factor C subunit [Apis cerana cerana]
MPRDIRSYFQTAKINSSVVSTKAVKRRIISSDEDDEKPKPSFKQSKKTKILGKKIIASDSEEDVKIVSPADIFGKNPIKRQEAPKISKQLQKKEAKSHHDDDFEKTLCQLDTSDIEQKYLTETKVNKDSHESNDKNKEKIPVIAIDSHENNDENKEKISVKSKENVKKKKTFDKTNQEKSNEKIYKLKLKKYSNSSNTSDIYEEIIAKKKQSVTMYQQYLQRGGARNPGSKKIPVGAEYCLAGLSFVITGVLDSLEREEAEELIKQYGGRTLHQVTKKTDYIIVGDQAGPSKLSKADSLNIKKISEDDLLDLIRTRPIGCINDVHQSRTKLKDKLKQKSEELEEESPSKKIKVIANEQTKNLTKIHKEIKDKKEIDDAKDIKTNILQDINSKISTQALVEKYKPKTMKQILGQQGDKSIAKKLYAWLINWHKNQSGQVKHIKPNPWAKNSDGAFFKAALLSGPPGIGKTTTVQVICNELGFDLIEFNASDTRSKKLLEEEVSELLSNTTLKNYFQDNKSKPSSKHVLLMDEVDGMAGNEDRGGLQELIKLIKLTDIPIVCICNDRNHSKMRTLANYTFDLRFSKPRLEQIRAAMKSICFKENINITNEDLDLLIESTNQDIRQIINHLALFVGQIGSQEKSGKKHVNKDLKLGSWDVVKQVFSAEEQKPPLFVQENYLLVIPEAPKNKLLEKIAESAESLAMGDIVENCIRSNNAWSLLSIQACYSSVIPGAAMSGHIGGQINFPAWLGRNSKTSKFNRLMQEITLHARLTTNASKEAINLDYIKYLRNTIIRPLAVDGIENIAAAIDVMNHYHLLREDLDSLVEISLWPGQQDPMQVIDSKVKAAFTRAYNKNSVVLPYVVNSTSKKKATTNVQEEGLEEEEEEVDSDQNDNMDTDKMIKTKKPGTNKNTESKSEKKGKKNNDNISKRGRGRGKAK